MVHLPVGSPISFRDRQRHKRLRRSSLRCLGVIAEAARIPSESRTNLGTDGTRAAGISHEPPANLRSISQRFAPSIPTAHWRFQNLAPASPRLSSPRLRVPLPASPFTSSPLLPS